MGVVETRRFLCLKHSFLSYLRCHSSEIHSQHYRIYRTQSRLITTTQSKREIDNSRFDQSSLDSKQIAQPTTKHLMGPKLLYAVTSSGGRQLMTVVKCCACNERSGLVSDYST